MESSANVVSFSGRSKDKRMSFSNVYEMRMYLQSLIRDSQMKYSVLAKKAAITSQTVSRIASGETKDPRTGTMLKLLSALGKRVYVE